MEVFSSSFLFDEISPIGIYDILKQNIQDENIHLFESVAGGVSSASIFTIGIREKVVSKNDSSFYTSEDNDTIEIDKNPLVFLKQYYNKIDKQAYRKYTLDLKIPFVDGFIGHISYDMIKYFEPKLYDSMNNLQDDIALDDFYFIRPKIIITYSHQSSMLTISTTDEKCEDRLDDIKNILLTTNIIHKPIKKIKDIKDIKYHHTKEQFMDIVRDAKDMIRKGDIFQILISNRAILEAHIEHISFYRMLRSINPSPYMFFLDYDDKSIIGSSPEILVSLNDNKATLNPIAGTRKRGSSIQRDKELEEELKNDEKEVSEHIMLVDLGRNDLNKVSISGSVIPSKLMYVEKYSHVMHLVSSLNSTLDDKYDMFDLIMATFTAGTMTGTPKIRAMELIAHYEKLKRSFYSGAIGYFGFDGNMDSSIAIRTAFLDEEKIILQAGAGVVADSKEELEYLEVKNKLQALISAIENLKE
jgi:anthranilate synthase component 1